MSAISNYRIDFVKRTKEILESGYQNFKDNDREATFLLNCLLGLIITISENEKKSKSVFKGVIDSEFIEIIPSKIGFIKKYNTDTDYTHADLTELILKIGHRDSLIGMRKLWFINKLRNGIAHQNIEAINESGTWTGIRLWNINNYSEKDFEIIFTISELKNLAIKLSDIYLKTVH